MRLVIMKKILLVLFSSLFLLTSCEKQLDTYPSASVSGPQVFENSENAQVAMNGIYRMTNTYGWGTSWHHENGGLQAFNLIFDLKGEDHLMDDQGSGWFYYDYAYDTQGDYKHGAGHQYQIWNFFYSMISNLNYVLANEEQFLAEPDQAQAKYVLGQAYAMRAMAYMYLIQVYQQNDPALPGVPIYTEPTIAGTEGKGRGTVQNVYDHANSDIDKAIEYFEGSDIQQKNIYHVDLYTAYGFKARQMLVQHKYQEAYDAAVKALSKKDLSVVDGDKLLTVNDAGLSNVMWAIPVQKDQAAVNGQIFYHMDAGSGNSYSKARHLISKALYDKIPETDTRLAWWHKPIPEDDWGEAGTTEGNIKSFVQQKLVFKDVTASTGDLIYMRAEEMVLVAAEAACHLGDYANARKYIAMLGEKRDSDYTTRLNGLPDGNTINTNTNGPILNLLDEIVFQRRVELWSENPRMFDLQRLGLGFDRDYDGSNHTEKLKSIDTTAGSKEFIMFIPQKEFEGNGSFSDKDQNP